MNNRTPSPDRRQPVLHRFGIVALILFLLAIVGTVSATVVVSDVVPDIGPNTGGTHVDIIGSGLGNVQFCTFNATAQPDETDPYRVYAAAFISKAGNLIELLTPAHPNGMVDVQCKAEGAGGSWSAINAGDHFTYGDAYAVTYNGNGNDGGAPPVDPSSPYVTGATVTVLGNTGSLWKLYNSFDGWNTATDGSGTPYAPAATFTMPAHAVTLYACWTANPPPAITAAINPTHGPVSGGTLVTITGTWFDFADEVDFGTTPADIQSVTHTQITVYSPPHIPGTVDVRVHTPLGWSPIVANDEFTYDPPVVTSVVPDQGSASGGTAVTINGDNFVGTTSVEFGSGYYAEILTVAKTQITVTTPTHGLGTVDVIVNTPWASSANTAADDYEFVKPSISGLSPDHGPVLGGTEVTISGVGLLGTDWVQFDTYYAPIISVAETSVVVDSPPHDVGPVDVKVHTAVGTSDTTTADVFTYEAVTPSITQVDPNTGPVEGGTEVTITGTYLQGADYVQFDTYYATINSVSPTSIVVYSPAHAPGTVDVFVHTPYGSDTATGSFGYGAVPAPSITQVDPNTGTVAGGTTVTITGTNFLGTDYVQIGGFYASINTVTATSISITTPPHDAGAVDVVVHTSGGSDTESNGFTYS